MEKKIAIFPGSFDPFTKGHAHIVEKALELFDEVIIYIAHNITKKRMFDARVVFETLKNKYNGNERVIIVMDEDLTVNVAGKYGAKFIVKGIRNATDAEYEISQAEVNKWLGGLQTVLIPCDKEYAHISSTLVRSLLMVFGENSYKAHEKAHELMA